VKAVAGGASKGSGKNKHACIASIQPEQMNQKPNNKFQISLDRLLQLAHDYFFLPVFMVEKHEVDKTYHNLQMDSKTDETAAYSHRHQLCPGLACRAL